MTVQALAALFFFLIAVNEARIVGRCDLAKTLKDNGMDKIDNYKLADWVCMAYHESRFNTRAVGPPNWDGSKDYGIFQINSRYWCSEGNQPLNKGCNKHCRDFIDDNIKDDIECAKRIVRDPNKMGAWVAWRNHCQGKDLSEWTRGCQL